MLNSYSITKPHTWPSAKFSENPIKRWYDSSYCLSKNQCYDHKLWLYWQYCMHITQRVLFQGTHCPHVSKRLPSHMIRSFFSEFISTHFSIACSISEALACVCYNRYQVPNVHEKVENSYLNRKKLHSLTQFFFYATMPAFDVSSRAQGASWKHTRVPWGAEW